MAQLVALFKKRKRWEQGIFIAVVALQLLGLYNVLVGVWLFAHHQFPLMNIRGAGLILGLLLLRLALLMYLARWQRPAFWMMLALSALAQLSGTIDIPDFLGAVLYAFVAFPLTAKKESSHA